MLRPLTQFQRAALFAKNAAHGRTPPDPTPASLWAQRIYHHPVYRVTYAAAALGNLLLAWWEPPSPSSLSSPDGLVVVRALDLAFLCLVGFDLFVLQLRYHGTRTWAGRGWVQAKLLAWVALAANLAVVVANPALPYLARVARPLLLIERLRNVRKIAARVAQTAPRVVNVGVLLGLHMLLSSVLAFVLFAGIDDNPGGAAVGLGPTTPYPGPVPNASEGGTCTPFRSQTAPVCSTFDQDGCHNYFADLGESMVHLFELTTAANFPAVMMPVFKCNPANALFFVVHVLVSFYLLLNLTLAVTYSTFREEMKEEVITKYKRAFKGFDMAFYELATPGAAARPGTETLKRPAFVTFFGCLRPDIAADAAGKLFDVFDGDRRGEIDYREFRRLLLNFGRLRIRAAAAKGSGGGDKGSSSPLARLSWGRRSAGTAGTAGTSDGAALSAGAGAPGGGADTAQWASEVADKQEGGDEDGDGDGDEEVEVLEIVAPRPTVAAGTALLVAGATTSPSTVVANPLAAVAAAAAAAAAASSSSPGAAESRSFRVESMRGVGGLMQASSPGPAVEAWGSSAPTHAQAGGGGGGGGDGEGSTRTAAEAEDAAWGRPRSAPRLPSSRSLLPPRPPPSSSGSRGGRCADCLGSLRAAIASGLSEETGADGYGRTDDEGVMGAGGGAGGGAPQTSASSASSSSSSSRGGGGSGGGGGGSGLFASAHRLPKGISPFSLRGKCVLLLKGLPATAFFDLCVLVNSLAGLAQLSLQTDVEDTGDASAVVSLEIVQYVTLAVFVLEVSAKLLAWGPRAYWRDSALHRLDVLLVLASVVGVGLEVAGVLRKVESSAIMFLRFVRLVRIFRLLPGFGLTVGALGDILPVLGRYVVIILAVFYVYAIVGMAAFSGKLTRDDPRVAATSYGGANYYAINFDTLPGAFLCLFYLVVLNDWPILMDAAYAATGTKAVRGYFISFWVVVVVLCMNVVVAFVIEAYSTEKEKRALLQLREDEERVRRGGGAGAGLAMLARGADGGGGVVESGVEDWRRLVLTSGVDFSGYTLSKARHHLDIYDALYRDDIRAAHRSTFGKLRGARGN
jgi:hypothetical protein